MPDSKEFSQRVLERLSEAVKNILHPSFYEHTLREIGIRLGQEVVDHVRPSHATARPFRQEDYLLFGVDEHTLGGIMKWGGNERPGRDFYSALPVWKLAAMIRISVRLSRYVGRDRRDHFGYGKVEICRGPGVPPKECSLTVHLERTLKA